MVGLLLSKVNLAAKLHLSIWATSGLPPLRAPVSSLAISKSVLPAGAPATTRYAASEPAIVKGSTPCTAIWLVQPHIHGHK